jgi:acetoin utilization protein AcuB
VFVRDRMSSPAVTMAPETSLQDALRLMREGQSRRLLVVDEDNYVLSVLTETDVFTASMISTERSTRVCT